MRYGKHVTVTSNGGLLEYHVKQFANYEDVKDYTVHTEQVRVRDEKEILAVFLNLLDRQKAGEIQEVGLQCLSDPKGVITRVEKSWVTKHLH